MALLRLSTKCLQKGPDTTPFSGEIVLQKDETQDGKLKDDLKTTTFATNLQMNHSINS